MLTCQNYNSCHMIEITLYKTNYEVQFSINPMLKDEIEKKNQLKRLSQLKLTSQICNLCNKIEITS